MSIQRWAPLAGSDFEQAPDGYYVTFEDHEQALAEAGGPCVACALDVPLSKAATLSVWAELQLRADNPVSETNQALVARLAAAQVAYDELVDVLRAVQLDHSRALDIGEDLERRIDELIGPHPRDGQ